MEGSWEGLSRCILKPDYRSINTGVSITAVSGGCTERGECMCADHTAF